MRQVLILVGSYILGCIPFGLIVGKLWRGVDIRNYGSGNIGATNVLRALGPGPAAIVFTLDVLKGLAPVLVAQMLFPSAAGIAVACGMISILGHSLSIFLRFRGGKGVATSLGVFIGLDWRVALIGFACWAVVVALTKYVSVGSILAAVAIPIAMFHFHPEMSYRIFALVAGVFVIVKHRSNMARLMHGKELRWGQKVQT